MGWFDRRKPPEKAGTAIQLREGGRHPFGLLERYIPLRTGEIALYRAIREAVPIVDAAILKLIRLAGGVDVEARDPRAREDLREFLRTVDTGPAQRGMQSFLDR